ncbi:MAG: hypothetical protein WA751_08595 [Candidatus Dormiibacterota bacterium]
MPSAARAKRQTRNNAAKGPYGNGSYWFEREAHGNWARFFLPDGRTKWIRSATQFGAEGRACPWGPITMEGYRHKIGSHFIRSFGRFKMAELRRHRIEHLYE